MNPLRLTVASAALCVALLPATSVRADFDFADFASTAGLSLVGDAATAGSLLRLTPAMSDQRGAAWFDTPLNVAQGFTTTAVFTMAPSGGADGMALVIQSDSSSALGGMGGACGYGYHDQTGQPGIPFSVAVELDTYLNGTSGDPDGNHVSVHTRGADPNDPDEIYSLGLSSAIPALDSGAALTLQVVYAPGSFAVYLEDLTVPVLDLAVDLADYLDPAAAWIGFTAGTGGLSESHDLSSWSLTTAAGGFRRGDANSDGGIDISDAVFTLASLFLPGSPPGSCEDALDVNDDGVIDISDAVFGLAALFLPGSPPVPPPAPDCGADPSADALSCDSFPACP